LAPIQEHKNPPFWKKASKTADVNFTADELNLGHIEEIKLIGVTSQH